MPNNDSHQHVVKTTAQWNERAIEYWIVPRGCLCVELTPQGKTKIKIGEGDKNYYNLPYICNHDDMYNYYTKEEVDTLFNNLNRMAIMSTEEYESSSDLPLTGNKLGDVRFVKSQSPLLPSDPDLYVWNGDKWILVGSPFVDISQFVTHAEFDDVKNKVDEIYPQAHTHDNKNILDTITQEDREKFDDLHNYDDTEIRNLINERTHDHPNKPVLDQITQADLDKLDSLHNYDDTEVKQELQEHQIDIDDLKRKAHTHDNKSTLDRITDTMINTFDEFVQYYFEIRQDIEDLKDEAHIHENMDVLNATTASYTLEDQVILYDLYHIGAFLGAGPTWDGTMGYVPAPKHGEDTYFLRGDGTWAKVKGGAGDKYKAGEGIYILSGEVTSDTFPFNVYSRGERVKQYIIYGNVGGVGELVNGQYHIPIVVSASGHPDRTSTIILSEPMYDGDYIDYERQVFAHYRTDISSQIQHVETDETQTGISSTGSLYYKSSYRGWGGSPRVTNYFELEEGASYEVSAVHPDRDFSDSLNINLYDVNKVRTRTIVTSTSGPTAFSPTSSEKYMRQSYTGVEDGYCHVFKLQPVEEPCPLQEILMYPNGINSVDVNTTIKPAKIYLEVEEPEDPDPDDPMSQYAGIIYNDGVIDITQEDPNNLNELTIHFRDDENKTITIPSASEMTGATASTDGEEGLVPAPLAGDENKFLRGDGTWVEVSGGENYGAGQGIIIEPSPSTLYTEIEYLKSTGTQYIKTDIMVDYTMKTEIDMVFGNTLSADTTGAIPFGVQANSAWYIGAFEYGTGDYDNFAFYDGYGWSSGMSQNHVISDVSYNTRSTVIIQRDNCSYGNASCTLTIPVTQNDPINPVSIFGVTNVTTEKPFTLRDMTLYSVKIYDSHANIIHDLVPVRRNADNVVGLYDTIINKFYTNTGTGSFVAGNDVGPVQSDTRFIDAKIGNGLDFDSNDAIEAKLGNGLRFDANNAIEVVGEPVQYVRVDTTDHFVLLHTKPEDWDTNWNNYYELAYDEITVEPANWDPTRHYKYENDNYVLGTAGDAFVSTTWYDKHYNSLDPNTAITFDSDVYYTGDLHLIEDGETFDTAFAKVNESIEHIERLEREVDFLHEDKVGVRIDTHNTECLEFYNR